MWVSIWSGAFSFFFGMVWKGEGKEGFVLAGKERRGRWSGTGKGILRPGFKFDRGRKGERAPRR